MDERKKFDMSLSNGQKQRLILAKMLYWLDENVDVLVLDEATSGLDDTQNAGANASEILEYIVRYANLDMKRTIIIATHQNINQFAKKLSDDGFVFRTLNFEKCGETNTVRQLQ